MGSEMCIRDSTCNHHLQLRLWWASTMHKTQGQTLDEAVIDLGPKEACTGLTFVCLSRAKRLVDLMVEPMSFDGIGNLETSSTMKGRLQEEVRLVEIAQSTRVRYTDMGVFSAVAGNQSSPIPQQMHDHIDGKKESYRLSSTCGAPRNHTNVPPVDAHV